MGSRQSRRSVLGNQPQALSLRRQQRLSQTEAPLFVEDAGARREELASRAHGAPRQRRYRSHALPQRIVGCVSTTETETAEKTASQFCFVITNSVGSVFPVISV